MNLLSCRPSLPSRLSRLPRLRLDTHEPPLFIEVCAGSALLSSLAREAGFSILPIDGGQRAARSYAHVLRLDLREDHTLPVPSACLAKPSCGLGAFFLRQQVPSAPPFVPRSTLVVCRAFPSLLRQRLLQQTRSMTTWCFCFSPFSSPFLPSGFPLSIPLGRLSGAMPALQKLTPSAWKVQVASCSFGASFARLALFVSNRDALSALESRCPGCPRHSKPPGSGVRMDGHYPKALCESFVKLVADSAVAAGLQLEPLAISTLQAARSAGQVQPRVSKYPPLISEVCPFSDCQGC